MAVENEGSHEVVVINLVVDLIYVTLDPRIEI